MDQARPGRDILDRALRTSWLAALALAATVAPGRPRDAAAILAGQLLAFLHFTSLRKIVKLFTEGRRDRRLALMIAAKVTLVYGGLAALITLGGVRYVPLCAGFALPFLMLFLKSIMLALGAGPASLTARRATETARSLGNAAKPAVFLLLLGVAALLAFSALPGVALADEAAHGAPATHDAAVAHGGAAVAHGDAAQHNEEGAAELPNWLVILHDFNPGNPLVSWLEKNQVIVFAWIAGLLFLLVSWLAMRKPKMVPGPFQNAVEWMVESMEEVCGGLLGPQIDKHFPLIGALFFYILTINMLGIIPGMKSATSSLDLTLALALITFLYVQFWGIWNLGIVGYLDHLAGSPRDAIGWAMLPVMLPVHVLGELAKPVSLSCRLFGNIFGEDTLIVVFVGATALLIKASLVALAVPPMAGITALFMMLQTLTSIVQALIFSLLATVYLYMMLPHEAHAHEEAHETH
ncbi:MAG: F0F1 ATP synthase subunit A [Candidatus Eisenbacteria bacterium]|uniref:ATP synthase subunit a n=1 Tax=Eiseniibacteriota bacterium TaxID=2212470 RepID=A0A538TEU5_UNCEI|nr:MAG: F0F1 ATP synthase subunit A [Candidatus Eisenbacteria bacterium]